MLTRRLSERFEQEIRAPALADIARRLDAGIAEARARWPELAGLDIDDAFVDAVAARVEGESDLAAAVTRLALPDVYLVTAVLLGQRGALAAFEQLVRDETVRAVARLGANAPAAEDVVQELLVKLLVAPAKLAAFGGHGALHAWLRVAAVRTAISLTRRKHEDPLADDELMRFADDADDQALAFLKSSYRAEFKRAFAETFAALPRRSRALLRLQILDQLTLEDIGAFYQVSRATAARWLADARAALVAGTRDRLVTTLAINTDELAELMQLVASTLYSTLPRLLRETSTITPA